MISCRSFSSRSLTALLVVPLMISLIVSLTIREISSCVPLWFGMGFRAAESAETTASSQAKLEMASPSFEAGDVHHLFLRCSTSEDQTNKCGYRIHADLGTGDCLDRSRTLRWLGSALRRETSVRP